MVKSEFMLNLNVTLTEPMAAIDSNMAREIRSGSRPSGLLTRDPQKVWNAFAIDPPSFLPGTPAYLFPARSACAKIAAAPPVKSSPTTKHP